MRLQDTVSNHGRRIRLPHSAKLSITHAEHRESSTSLSLQECNLDTRLRLEDDIALEPGELLLPTLDPLKSLQNSDDCVRHLRQSELLACNMLALVCSNRGVEQRGFLPGGSQRSRGVCMKPPSQQELFEKASSFEPDSHAHAILCAPQEQILPMHIRGPPLKGMYVHDFGVQLSQRSGSKSR